MNAHFAQSMETSLAWYEKLLPTADENLEKARPFLDRRNSDYVPVEIMQLLNDADATIFRAGQPQLLFHLFVCAF